MPKLSLLLRIFALLCASVLLTTQTAVAGGFAVDVDENGVAVKGHDPVAYFADARPTMGSADYIADADGATYYFASSDNRDQFLADPAKYTPAYGGFCALGITRSMKVTGDPNAWKIADGRLYINSSHQAQDTWSEDIPGNIVKADEAWPAIKDTDPADL
jgi:YHS domain-containing protein